MIIYLIKVVKAISVTDTSKDRAIRMAEQHLWSNEANRRIVQIEKVIVKTTDRKQEVTRVRDLTETFCPIPEKDVVPHAEQGFSELAFTEQIETNIVDGYLCHDVDL